MKASEAIHQMKIRTISEKSLSNIKTILTKMNSQTRYADDGYSFTAEVLNKISIADKAEFIDGRAFINKIPDNIQMQKESRFISGKTKLIIDNKSGKIINFNKPFFKSWKKILKDFDKYINMFVQNFDNKNVVRQHKHFIFGFTQKGAQKINELQRKMNNPVSVSGLKINLYNNI